MRWPARMARTTSQTASAMGTPNIKKTMGIQSISFTFQQPRRLLPVVRADGRIAVSRGLDVVEHWTVRGIKRCRHASRLRSVMIDQPVVRKTIQVRRKFSLHGVRGARAYQIHPYILEQFFGHTAVAALAQHIAEQPALVTAVEHVERTGFAIAEALHQNFVAAGNVLSHIGLPV